jgi:hypothetical protein
MHGAYRPTRTLEDPLGEDNYLGVNNYGAVMIEGMVVWIMAKDHEEMPVTEEMIQERE